MRNWANSQSSHLMHEASSTWQSKYMGPTPMWESKTQLLTPGVNGDSKRSYLEQMHFEKSKGGIGRPSVKDQSQYFSSRSQRFLFQVLNSVDAAHSVSMPIYMPAWFVIYLLKWLTGWIWLPQFSFPNLWLQCYKKVTKQIHTTLVSHGEKGGS